MNNSQHTMADGIVLVMGKLQEYAARRIAIYPESSEAEPWDRSSVGLSRFAVALFERYGRHLPHQLLSLADRLPC